MSEKDELEQTNEELLEETNHEEEVQELEQSNDEILLEENSEEEVEDLEKMDGVNELPKVQPAETEEAVNPGQSVQLSLDPTIKVDEEKIEAQQDHRKKNMAILEGLLFLTGDEGLTISQASAAMDLKKDIIEELFDELQKSYLEDSRGFEIERFGETYRFLSKALVHDAAKKLFQINNEAKLSNAALETLAIVAYKQPVTRVEIEEIRGVGADVMLHKLEARGFIEEKGRSDAPGRPILYTVTENFMDAFQLMSLEELPELPKFADNQEGSDDLFTQ